MSRSERGRAREARPLGTPVVPDPAAWSAGYMAGMRGLELAPDAAPDFRTGHATGLGIRPTLLPEVLEALDKAAADAAAKASPPG